jgi:hypothetical protein
MSRPSVRLVAVVFLLSVPLSAESLPELFQKAKEQAKSHSWHEALTTLDQLDAASAKGNGTARRQLVAPIACGAHDGRTFNSRISRGGALR